MHRLPRSERKTAPPATQPRPSAVPRAGTQTSTAVEGEKARPTAIPVARPIAPAGHGRPPPALRRAMSPQGAVAGTGGPDRPAARPGLAGASGSWAVALLRARGPAPRVPGPRMLFGMLMFTEKWS